jgi:hypothetical protein
MKRATERAGAKVKARRGFRLEWLEGRELLSVARPLGVAADLARSAQANTPITTITGRVQGHMASNGFYTGTPAGYQSFSGHGRATPVGTVYLGVKQREALNTATSPEALTILYASGELMTLRGERIDLFYTGSGSAPARGSGTYTVQGRVTSGTGRFDGVSGTFSATGTVSHSGRFALNFTMNLVYPTAA